MWFKEKKKEYKNNELLHEREKEEFLRLLNQTGEELPQGGKDMVDVFLKTEGHISQDFFQKKLSETGIDADPETVKNMLELLCRYGIAQKAVLNGKGPWYEHLHIGNEHDHLLCARCGKVAEITDSIMKKGGLRSQGTMVLSHWYTRSPSLDSVLNAVPKSHILCHLP
jgi:Fur family ferric uptake transcriptional regulator